MSQTAHVSMTARPYNRIGCRPPPLAASRAKNGVSVKGVRRRARGALRGTRPPIPREVRVEDRSSHGEHAVQLQEDNTRASPRDSPRARRVASPRLARRPRNLRPSFGGGGVSANRPFRSLTSASLRRTLLRSRPRKTSSTSFYRARRGKPPRSSTAGTR